MRLVTKLAARLDIEALNRRGVAIAPFGTDVSALRVCEVAELHGRPLIKYLTRADSERFANAFGVSQFAGEHRVTPTAIAASDLSAVLGFGGLQQPPLFMLLLDSERLASVLGPRYLDEDETLIEYVLPDGFSSDAILSPGVLEYGPDLEVAEGAHLGTVLFTDIVDSTGRAVQMGDAAWNDVQQRHDLSAQSVIEEHGGRFVKSTGDGVLGLFPSPSRAVSCGLRLCSAAAAMGLPIRAGAHLGELYQHADGDVLGIAVNLAARVMSHARDGELWVSSTVKEAILRGDTSFSDEGPFELRGFEGEQWTLFSVPDA